MVADTSRVSRCAAGPTVAGMLPDGTYDVFVVDAAADGEGGALRLDLTILAGEHKGELVSTRAEGLGVGEVDALGMPGTLTVRGGDPSLRLE